MAQKPTIKPQKHPIYKAISCQKMLDSGNIRTKAEIARIEGQTPARITQIMYLLKLPGEVKKILMGLSDPKGVKKYSVRKILSGQVKTCKSYPLMLRKKARN